MCSTLYILAPLGKLDMKTRKVLKPSGLESWLLLSIIMNAQLSVKYTQDNLMKLYIVNRYRMMKMVSDGFVELV